PISPAKSSASGCSLFRKSTRRRVASSPAGRMPQCRSAVSASRRLTVMMLWKSLQLPSGILPRSKLWRKGTQQTVAKLREKVEDKQKSYVRPAEDAGQHRADGKEEGRGEPQRQRRSAGPGKDRQHQRCPPGELAQMPPGR